MCCSSSDHRPLFRLSLILSLIVSTAGFAIAQNTNSGEIRGTVTDPTGAVLPGAAVTILNVDTGGTRGDRQPGRNLRCGLSSTRNV